MRVDLAAAYRLVARYGWEDLIFTHIRARVPGTEDQFLINPYGFFFDEITASSLVKIDTDGKKVQDSPFDVNAAGFIIHSAIHAARHDAKCVLHTHTASGVAVAAQRAGLLPISQHSLFVLTSLGYHDFEGPALHDDEKPRLVADLGDNSALILRNHGLLTVGETVADAFVTHVLPGGVLRDPGARAVRRRRADLGAQGSHGRGLRERGQRAAQARRPGQASCGRACCAGSTATDSSFRN